MSVICIVATKKCHHCCSVNVSILLPLYVAVVMCKCCVCVLLLYLSSKCHQCCGVRCCCNCAMKLLLYVAAIRFVYIPHNCKNHSNISTWAVYRPSSNLLLGWKGYHKMLSFYRIWYVHEELPSLPILPSPKLHNR